MARLPAAVRTSCGRLLAEMDALEELKAEALHDMVEASCSVAVPVFAHMWRLG